MLARFVQGFPDEPDEPNSYGELPEYVLGASGGGVHNEL